MKRFGIILACALLLLTVCACGRGAQETGADASTALSPAPTLTADASAAGQAEQAAQPKTRIDFVGQATADLDGDGAYEMIYVDSDESTGALTLRVERDSAAVAADTVSALTELSKFVADVDESDGTRQVFLTGKTASGAAVSYVYRLTGDTLTRTQLEGTVLTLYGDGRLLVRTSVAVLGSYEADCVFAVNDDGSFGPVADYEICTDADFEEARKLRVKKDGLQAYTAAGETIDVPAGTELVLRSTNGRDTARCSSTLGEDVYFSLTLPEDAAEWWICGAPESEWFDNLLYGD